MIPGGMFSDPTWWFDEPLRFVGLMLVVWALGRWRADRRASQHTQSFNRVTAPGDLTPRRSGSSRPLIEVVDDDAVLGLVSLGFSRRDALAALDAAGWMGDTTEERVIAALRRSASRSATDVR